MKLFSDRELITNDDEGFEEKSKKGYERDNRRLYAGAMAHSLYVRYFQRSVRSSVFVEVLKGTENEMTRRASSGETGRSG